MSLPSLVRKSVDPTVNDDITGGYVANTQWLNTTTGLLWTCQNNADGAAVWIVTGRAGNPSNIKLIDLADFGSATLTDGYVLGYDEASETFVLVAKTPGAGTVTAAMLASNAVETAKLAAGAVTLAKMSAAGSTVGHLLTVGADGVITAAAPSAGGGPAVYTVPSANWWINAPSGTEIEGECAFVSHAGSGDFAGKDKQLAIKGASSWTFINPATATQSCIVRVLNDKSLELRLDVVANEWTVASGGFNTVQDATGSSFSGTTFAGAAWYVAGSGSGQWSGFDRKVVIAHATSPASGSDWTAFTTDYPIFLSDVSYSAVRAKINAGGSLVSLT